MTKTSPQKQDLKKMAPEKQALKKKVDPTKDADCLISHHKVDEAIIDLAERLNQHFAQDCYRDQTVAAFCIMNGGLYFTGQLMRHLNFPMTISYLHATRYGDQTRGSELNWKVRPTKESIAARHIVLIDDIFDEGLTLEAITKDCLALKPASLHSVVLIDKNHQRKPESGFKPDFIGLEVEDRYIFGCGMDYQGLYRNLPAIYAMKR